MQDYFYPEPDSPSILNLSEILETVQYFIEDNTTSSFISTAVRCLPYEDKSSLVQALSNGWTKELQAAQERLVEIPAIPWPSIFRGDYQGVSLPNLQNQRIHHYLRIAKERLQHMDIFPNISEKTIGVTATRNMEEEFGRLYPNSTIGLERRKLF